MFLHSVRLLNPWFVIPCPEYPCGRMIPSFPHPPLLLFPKQQGKDPGPSSSHPRQLHTWEWDSLHCVSPSSSEAPRKTHRGLSYTAPGTSHGRKQPGGSCPLAAALSGQPAGEGMGFILNLSLLLKNSNQTAQSRH